MLDSHSSPQEGGRQWYCNQHQPGVVIKPRNDRSQCTERKRDKRAGRHVDPEERTDFAVGDALTLNGCRAQAEISDDISYSRKRGYHRDQSEVLRGEDPSECQCRPKANCELDSSSGGHKEGTTDGLVSEPVAGCKRISKSLERIRVVALHFIALLSH